MERLHSNTDHTDADAPLPRGTVAIVDDDRGIAQALQVWLDHVSIPVRTFADGLSLLDVLQPVAAGWVFKLAEDTSAQADTMGQLEAAPPLQQRLQAVVIDLNLPGPNGFQIARQLREHAPDLPVVVITAASVDSQNVLGGVPAGVVCLSKPFDLDVLESALLGR